MIRRILVSVCLMMPLVAVAAERELLWDGDVRIGGFGGPALKVANIKGGSHLLLGGQGSLLINQHLYLGGGGYGTINEIGDGYGSYSYGGVHLGTFFNQHKAVHYYIEMGIYSGNISPTGTDINTIIAESEQFTLYETSFGLALNLMEYSKMTIGLSHRSAQGVDTPELSADELGGASFSLAMQFGVF